jgi:hypothetical protein
MTTKVTSADIIATVAFKVEAIKSLFQVGADDPQIEYNAISILTTKVKGLTKPRRQIREVN